MNPTLLHIGCGRNRIDATTPGFRDGGWDELRVDIDAAAQPDVIASMTDLSILDDRSVQAVYSSHNLEHLYPHEVPVALREFRRVLSDDGFCVLTCPDLKSICALVVDGGLEQPAYVSPAGPIFPLDVLYGHRPSMEAGNLFMAHRTGFTEESLRRAFVEAGFASVITWCHESHFALWVVAARSPLDEGRMRELAHQHLPILPQG